MIIKVDKYLLARILAQRGRDYYTIDGLEFIMDYIDDVDPEWELDVLAICGDFTEYGKGAVLDISDFFNDYADSSFYEFCKDTGKDPEDVETLVQYVNDTSPCFILENGNIMKARLR